MSPGDNIVLLSTNDTLGGAAIATHRLMQSLHRQGCHVKMVVCNQAGDDPAVVTVGSKCSRRRAFMAERLQIARHNGLTRRDLFAVSTGRYGQPLSTHPDILRADTIIVGWTSQGLLSLDMLDDLASMPGKEIIVVMHDLWAMTGICHHPGLCRRFEGECGCCPLLHGRPRPDDLSHRVWLQKQALYRRHPDISFVAVSSWVRDMARRSSLLGERKIEVKHNVLSVDDYHITPRGVYHLPSALAGKHVIVMGAARLDDPVKGFDIAVDAINLMAERWPERVVDTALVLFGAIRDTTPLCRLAIETYVTGMLSQPQVADLMSQADVVLSSSLYETYGLTLLEGIFSGAWGVTFGVGGQTDIVIDGVNGFVVTPHPATDRAGAVSALADALNRAITMLPVDRMAQCRSVSHLTSEWVACP